ncbi:T-cell-specific guanine nucleotide triphosphate-binding protein 2-like isoform X2 [Mya arenaria]|nr:T-cell-specific guanine nucleotide triphosphate-binding protein 2-like isoform X2 [Mya arenaria]XP_052816092.1 T-cell-specific guanine nucleotide triphosphate-binding protein 2-like isoform X2 [Mya arenaria]
MDIHWTMIAGFLTIIAWFWYFNSKMNRLMQDRGQHTMLVKNDKAQQTEVYAVNMDQQTKVATINRYQQTEVATNNGEVITIDKHQQTELETVDRGQQTELETVDKHQQTEIETVDRDQQTDICKVEQTRKAQGLVVDSDFVGVVQNELEKFENSSMATKYIDIKRENGTKGLEEKLKIVVNKWKTTKLNIAVIGQAGVGKSTFINTFLGNRIAKTGCYETTVRCEPYFHPKNDNMILWDVPGVGTRSFPRNDYLQKINFQSYDFFLLMLSERVYENDLWLMKCILKMKKKAYIIRSKTDQAIENAQKDYPGCPEKEVLDMIKDNIVKEFLSEDIRETNIYLLSGQDDSRFDFKLLVSTLLRETPELKRCAMIFSVSPLSNDIITAKVEELKARIYIQALAASIGATIPIPGAGILVQVALLYEEADFYREQLGTDEDSLNKIAERLQCPVEDLQIKLDMKMHIILRTKTAFLSFLGTTAATEGIQSVLKLAIPIIGSLIAASTNYPLCVYSLRKILSEVEKEARSLNAYVVKWIESESQI